MPLQTLEFVFLIIGIANLIPCLIYLDYKRRLRQYLERRRRINSEEIADPSPSNLNECVCELFTDEEAPTSPSNRLLSDDDRGPDARTKLLDCGSIEEPSSLVQSVVVSTEEAARAFVAHQESILSNTRALWNTNKNGRHSYGSLPSTPPKTR